MKKLTIYLLLLLSTACTSFERDPYGDAVRTLDVTVVYPEEYAQYLRAGVDVTLSDRNSGNVYTAQTDDSGAAEFRVTAGHYKLSVLDLPDDEAVELDSMYYVDGGVFNNLPAQAIRDKCTYLIGSNVNPEKYRSPIKSGKDVAMRSVSILIYENTKPGIEMCDFMVDVPVNYFYSPMDFKHFYEIYQIGYKAGLDYIKEHPEIVRKCKGKRPDW